jgi:WD40 repeat protein
MSQFHKDALPSGYELDEYQIESVLGHGGFGITYRARDRHLDTLVAIKEYFPGELAARQDIALVVAKPTPKAQRDYFLGLKNFIKEARALARFKHPNIVRVLRYLEAHGTAYMVMEYEQGGSLADQLRREGPKLTEPALHRVFLPILNGVHAVHGADMLHLDIKPENIYLRRDGSPMLIDFGSTRQAISQTMPDKFLVTHGYAPIEQYPDKGKQGAWTDVYALGASMYRCISGKRPVNALERYQAILNYQTDPMAPAVVAGKGQYSPLLLECIDWALQIHPRDRPQSVRDFQDRLLRHAGSPTRSTSTTGSTTTTARFETTGSTTRPPVVSSARRTPRTRTPVPRRRPWLLPVLVLVTAGAVAYLWYLDRAVAPSKTAASPVAPPEVAARATPSVAEVAAVSNAGAPPVLYQTLDAHKDSVLSIAFSANGKRLASGGADTEVRVWDSASGALLKTLTGHTRAVSAVSFSDDGRWLASASQDGHVRLWDARALTAHAEWRGPGGPLHALAFAPHGRRVAAAGRARHIVVWDVADARVALTLPAGGEVRALAFSPDGQWLAAAGADGTVRLFDAVRGGEPVSRSVHRAGIHTLAFSPDGRWLATGTDDHLVRLIEVGGSQVRVFPATGAPVTALAYVPGGQRLVAGTTDGKILELDAENGQKRFSLDDTRDAVTSVAVSADGRLLVSGARDRRVRLWRYR